jgi:Zn-dependent protease with chaperone function
MNQIGQNHSLGQISLIGLKADQFRHPLDLEATQRLKQLPGWDVLVRTVLGTVAEQFFYMENIATSLQVSDRQLPKLHALLQEACQILDLEVPQLYVRQHPTPNAYTMAIRGKQPFIVLHTSLIELLNPAEIQAVIAHELGHLKCEHGLYLTLANLLMLAATQIPLGGLLIQGWQEQLMRWVRCAELTCDRAALLATQDPRITMSVLMKLAGGSPSLVDQLNLDAFVEQARAYDAASQGDLGQMLRQMQTAQLTHPLPVLRAREIDRWAKSPAYQTLLQNQGKSGTPVGWKNW